MSTKLEKAHTINKVFNDSILVSTLN